VPVPLLWPEKGPLQTQQELIELQVLGFFQEKEMAFVAEEGDFLMNDGKTEELLAQDAASEAAKEAYADKKAASGNAGTDGLAAMGENRRKSSIPLTGADGLPFDKQKYIAAIDKREKQGQVGIADVINPLAKVLGPVQDSIGRYLVLPTRAATNLLSWEDPFATSWFCVLLFFLMICFAFIPWATIMIVMLRVGGLLAFGPHMHIVGKRLNDAADVTSAAEDAFEQLSPADKEKRLKTYREDLIKAEARRILTDAARLEPNARRRLLERATFFEECGSRRVLVPSELSAARIMPGAPIDTARSRARSLVKRAPVLHGDLESTGADNAMNPVEAAVLASRQAALAMEAKREEMSRGLEAGGQEVARAMKARQEDVVRAGEGMARALKGSGMGLVNNVDRMLGCKSVGGGSPSGGSPSSRPTEGAADTAAKSEAAASSNAKASSSSAARASYRPDTGKPSRPDTGKPYRPDTGAPYRPDAGSPYRPDTGSAFVKTVSAADARTASAQYAKKGLDFLRSQSRAQRPPTDAKDLV